MLRKRHIFRFIWTVCLVLLCTVMSTTADAKSVVSEKFRSGPWLGKVFYDASGKGFQSCGIWARNHSGDWLGFLLSGDGNFRLSLYNEKWQLPENFTFDSIALLDRKFKYELKGRRTSPEQIDFEMKHTLKEIELFQAGALFQITTPFGPKAFSLRGTRKALNKLIQCRAEKLLYSQRGNVSR